MANNKIIIGNSKEKNEKVIEPIQKDTVVNTGTIAPNTEQKPESEQKPVQEPIYENVWGNDHVILKVLDEKQLSDRRLYARAIYMQNIECNAILGNMESEPVLLAKPMNFMVIDISMSGIGIICKDEINKGMVLIFKLILDNIAYEIKCEVIYSFQVDDKFRAGLKMVGKDKKFIKHLKIVVARLTLQREYGTRVERASQG